MNLRLLSVLTASLTLAVAAGAQEDASKKLDPKRFDHFGAGIVEGSETLKLADVMADPAKYADQKIRLEAPITGVCQSKGCWMNLGKPLPNGSPPIFVKFKDYAFFVPKDASGRNAIVEGVLAVHQETVEETKHHLKDAGKHEQAEKVTEGRKILRFMADGVAIEKPHTVDLANCDQFGDGVEGEAKTLTLAEVMADPAKYTDKKIRLAAPITGVCQAKGCWMNLGAPLENGNPPVFVKFKDYAFFVPKDASGRHAVVEGVLSFKQETVAETKHHLEDAGKHEEAEKVTEGRKILRFMADGVAIEKRAEADQAEGSKPKSGK